MARARYLVDAIAIIRFEREQGKKNYVVTNAAMKQHGTLRCKCKLTCPNFVCQAADAISNMAVCHNICGQLAKHEGKEARLACPNATTAGGAIASASPRIDLRKRL